MNSSESMIYLRTHVKPILAQLIEEIGRRRPEDIVNFSIEWLKLNETRRVKEYNEGWFELSF